MLSKQLSLKTLGTLHDRYRGVQPMPFIEVLRKTKAEGLARGALDSCRLHSTATQNIPFVELLRKMRAEALARPADPWAMQLERVRGKAGYDGVERVSTQDVFDFLEVPQRARTAGACRRLAALMRELGWTPVKARGMTQGGFRDQVRGYARPSSA
jgi:hypothetical protein